jgi:dihydrofolate reductase
MEALLAIDLNNGLSKNGVIPWKSKRDMKFFLIKQKII